MPINPEKKRAYDQLMGAAQSATQLDDRLGLYRTAARAFEGSRDPEELELRFQALTGGANLLRSAKRLPEAEAAFQQLAETLQREAGARGFAYWFAHYKLGLVREERGDDVGSAEALRIAQEGFRSDGLEKESIAAGAARGLSLLRAQQWAQCAEVLTALRPQVPANDPITRASVLNNLTIALARCGRATEAATVGAEALALRTERDGFNHPTTIDTALVHAYALVEADRPDEARTLVQRAANIIFANVGEAHSIFADALLVEARRLARLGDGVGAEALARRALFILERCEVDARVARQRRDDAAAIAGAWRNRRGGPGRTIWKLQMQHTLRRYRAATLDFEGSGDRPKTWFVVVPASWTNADAAYAARLVFADCDAFLNSREPADANALDATHVEAQVVGALDQASVVAAFRDRVWEPSAAFDLTSGNSARPMSFEELTGKSGAAS